MNLSRPARLQHLATALCSLFQPFPGRGEAGPAFGILGVRAPGLCLPQEVAVRGRGAGREPRGGCPEARRAPGCRLPAAGRRFFGTGPRSDGGGGLGRSLQPPCSQPSYPFLQFQRMPRGLGLMAYFEQLATCCLGKGPPRGFLGRN